jgi:hypothetical protein
MAAFCCHEISREHRSAPKQAHRMRAVDAEFIGLLTLIDRFPPTAPGPRFSITLEYQDPATFTADVGSKV